MDGNVIRLVLPILISLIITTIVIGRMISSSSKVKTLVYSAIISGAILLLGTLWFWNSVTDGLAQITQAVIYIISFIVILVINYITATIGKRRVPQN
jgi:hypothetical protein